MQFIRNGSAGSVYGDGASQQLVPIHGFSDFFRSNRGMQAAWMGVGGVLQVLQLAENGSRQAKLPECSRYHVCGCVCECAPAAMN